jgi:hypothetical protein
LLSFVNGCYTGNVGGALRLQCASLNLRIRSPSLVRTYWNGYTFHVDSSLSSTLSPANLAHLWADDSCEFCRPRRARIFSCLPLLLNIMSPEFCLFFPRFWRADVTVFGWRDMPLGQDRLLLMVSADQLSDTAADSLEVVCRLPTCERFQRMRFLATQLLVLHQNQDNNDHYARPPLVLETASPSSLNLVSPSTVAAPLPCRWDSTSRWGVDHPE